MSVERQYPRLQQEPRDDPPHFDGPERQGLGRRLFIGFLIAIGAALACWWGGPKLGLDVPWYVPVIAFGIIVVATILPIITQPAPPGPDVDPGPDPNDQSP